MKEIEIILKDRLIFLMWNRNNCLYQADRYYRWCKGYTENDRPEKGKYKDSDRYWEAFNLSDLYRRISLYREEIKVLVTVLKIIKKKGEDKIL